MRMPILRISGFIGAASGSSVPEANLSFAKETLGEIRRGDELNASGAGGQSSAIAVKGDRPTLSMQRPSGIPAMMSRLCGSKAMLWAVGETSRSSIG